MAPHGQDGELMGKLFSFEMAGLDELQADLARRRQALEDEKALEQVMVEALQPILDRLKIDLPRSDIAHEHTVDQLVINTKVASGPGIVRAEIGVRAGSNSIFAMRLRFIELGTSKLPARPVMRQTWDAEQEAYVGRVVAGLGRAMRRG